MRKNGTRGHRASLDLTGIEEQLYVRYSNIGRPASAHPMDFNLTDEQQMLRDGVRRFATERYSFEARKRLLATVERFSPQNWRTYAELGWLALALPEEVGGLDCS